MSTVFEANQRAALTIRDARTEELDDVVQVLHLAYREYIPSPLPAAHAKAWRAYWRDIGDVRGRLSCAELIVAELAGRIVGTVTMYPDGTRVKGAGWPTGWAGVRLLGVVPETSSTPHARSTPGQSSSAVTAAGRSGFRRRGRCAGRAGCAGSGPGR